MSIAMLDLRKVQMKNRIWPTLIVAIAIILGWGIHQFYLPETQMLLKLVERPEYMKVDERKPLKDQTRLVEIGGRRFNVPLMYIDGGLDEGVVQRGMNLICFLPDCRSLWELKNREEYLKEFDRGHAVYMLIIAQSTMPPIEISATNILNGYSKKEYVGKVDGLEKYNGYFLNNGNLELYDEFYLEKSKDNKVIGFVDCSPQSRVPNPGCNHHFIDKSLRYDIHYNTKNYFSQWQEQKQKAIKFIDSFEAKSEQKKTGK